MGHLTGNVTGFSAQIIRATIATDGGHVPVVIKQDAAEVIDREVTFYERFGAPIADWLPTLRGHGMDDEQDTGVLVLDDIGPADQLDVLDGCDDDQADALVTALARLHAAYLTRGDDAIAAGLPRWRRRPMEPGRWADRVAVASDRFPLVFGPEVLSRLVRLPDDVAAVLRLLDRAPPTVLHGDVHLDNVMWRHDGRMVLLDWAGAAVGAAAVDVASCLLGGLVNRPDDQRTGDLVATYGETIHSSGVSFDAVNFAAMVDAAILVLTQGLVGWAGSPGLQPGSRAWSVCHKQADLAIAWITR